MTLVNENFCEIMKFKACQLHYTQKIAHTQYDAENTNGYKLTLLQTTQESMRSILDRREQWVYLLSFS